MGSEMCIRDRPRTPERLGDAPLDGQPRPGLCQGRHDDLADPIGLSHEVVAADVKDYMRFAG